MRLRFEAETEAVKFEVDVDVVGDRSGVRLGQTGSTLSLSMRCWLIDGSSLDCCSETV